MGSFLVPNLLRCGEALFSGLQVFLITFQISWWGKESFIDLCNNVQRFLEEKFPVLWGSDCVNQACVGVYSYSFVGSGAVSVLVTKLWIRFLKK